MKAIVNFILSRSIKIILLIFVFTLVVQSTHGQYITVFYTINYKTAWSREIKIVKLANFDFNSQAPKLMADILTSKSGDITDNFSPYTSEKHRDFVTRVIQNWRANNFATHITDGDVEKMIRYPQTMILNNSRDVK